MANQKILEEKQTIIDEVEAKVKDSSCFVAFEYHGLSVSETMELRRKLKDCDSELKIYKNTLVNRALKSLNIDLEEELNGPKAFAFGKDAVAPIKVLSDFSKKHPALVLKVGIVDGAKADIKVLNELASIPSREGLLTMLAGGLLETLKNMAICLELHKENLEKEN